MLVEQLGAHGQVLLRQRVAGAGTRCRVGRDLGCDIVVDDEYAAPQHALLTLLDDGRVRVQDLGGRNVTRVDGQPVPADAGVVIGHGEVLVGRTRLRIRTRHAPLGPERLFRRNFLRRHRTLLAAAGVSACVAAGAFLQWLDAPSSLLRSVTIAALVVLGAIAAWSGLWALITKLNHGGWHLRVHLAIASFAAASCVLGYWAAGTAAFATQWPALAQAGVAVVSGVVLLALYLHLREATPYGGGISLALAAAATAVIAAIAWSIAVGVEDSDVNRVDLGPPVRLGAQRIVPTRDVADYLAEVDELRREAGRERQKSLLGAPLADADE